MIADLIASWGQIKIPENTEVRFLIVENDDAERTRELIESKSPLQNGLRVDYVLEPEPGIPFGRNRAAKEAIASGHQLLVFVDDDEVVAEDWLLRLLEGYRNSDAVLMGAPLRAAPPIEGLSWFEHVMHRNIASRYKKKEVRARSRASLDATPGVTVVTNNWIAETRLFSEFDVWFDENMRFTGGTDSKFCAEVKANGYKVGWVSDAYVYETISKERLSFWYQYRRARDQSNTHFHRKKKSMPYTILSLLVTIPVKSIFALALFIAIPLTFGKTLLQFARISGWMAGRLGGVLGVRSNLYKKITGH